MAGLGAKKRVAHLTVNDVDRYAEMRRSGDGWPDGRKRQPVRARAAREDLELLRTMILWATRERSPDGPWLLSENPLRGLRLPKEEDPMRPVATHDRFLKVRKAAHELALTARHEGGEERWLRLELALVLAEATGRRIGAIRGLRWSDISFDPPSIHWRADFDKRGREATVPMPQELADEIRRFLKLLAVVGDGWLFPSKRKNAPLSTDYLGQLLSQAERKAGVPKLKGGRWHPYRRKWATERKSTSVKNTMDAGGWKDMQTLLKSYQQADEAGMLEAMSWPVKLRDRKVSNEA
jgi:integrase